MTENKIVTCPKCGHIEWRAYVKRDQCRVCAVFDRYRSSTLR